MSDEIRAWITSQNADCEGLTAGELKEFLEHVPAEAVMADGADAVLTSIEAVWEAKP